MPAQNSMDCQRKGGINLQGRTITYSVSAEDAGLTMKSFLRNRKKISRKLLIRMKQEQSIFLNGRFTYLDHPLYEGDVITFVMPEETSENIVPEPMELHIVFEDEDLMVIDKPYGQCAHPTLLHPTGTLANGVVHYWQKQGFQRKFRAVNRLDKDTTGLIIIAKSQYAHQQLAISQQSHHINRTYEAIAHGIVKPDFGVIDAPIARRSESLVEREVSIDGQYAVTHYEVLKAFPQATYLRLRLETGRTHQIRVHLSSIGHPLLGDDLYGGSLDLIQRQALHARFLSFPHPLTKQEMSFEAELPSDFRRVLEMLESNQ